MKKILALILSVAAVFSLAGFATLANAPSQKTEVLHGETVTVAFSLPEEYSGIRSGSISFDYDDSAFELVSGSAKWTLSGILIKDVKESTKQGVFAFAEPKSIGGEVFTMTFKVKDGAELGDYSVTARLDLNQKQTVLDLESAIAVVAERVEVEDDVTPAVFKAAVDKIKVKDATEETYRQIVEALEIYETLSETEKDEASTSYGVLLYKIREYNSASTEINTAAESVLEVALGAISDVFDYISRLFKAMIEMICA